MNIKAAALGFAVSVLVAMPAAAGIDDKLEDWFEQEDYANVTAPGVYEGQTARYATLGGISYRAPITHPFNFVNVQTPKFSAGCGGIDFYSGGFSAIDADQFVDNLKAIGSNAKSLVWMLAIQVVSPQLSDIIKEVNNWAQKINALNMDSCQAAAALVGGTLEMFSEKQQNCISKRMNDYGEDWTAANYACTTGGGIKSTEAAGDPNSGGADFTKGNLAWYVMMKDPLFASDTEFAQLLMNMTGTLIIGDAGPQDDDPSSIRRVPSAFSGREMSQRAENIYKALLHGADAADGLKLYKCVGAVTSDPMKGCQNVTDSLESVPPTWVGLHSRVEDMVSSIIDKIYTDVALSDAERGLVSTTSIPLYRLLTAQAAYYARDVDLVRFNSQYTRLIAEDILARSLIGVLEAVEARSKNLDNGVSRGEKVLEFIADINDARAVLAKLREKTQFDANQLVVMQQNIQLYERSLMSRLGSGLVQASMWEG